MNVLKKIQGYAGKDPERVAVRTGEKSLTYGSLWKHSDILAAWLEVHCGENHDPVAVYGHKNPWMLVCFLACVKSGRAYCPIDCSVPEERVAMILQALPSKIVLTTEEMAAVPGEKQVVSLAEQQGIVAGAEEQSGIWHQEFCGSDREIMTDKEAPGDEAESHWVCGEDTYYIIFTSGSTGTPKGVEISADCLNHYLDWSVTLGNTEAQKQGKVFLNQAPFSFDLSVMDLYTCLACGGTLYCLEKEVQSDYRLLMEHLEESKASVWVSTPSFADVCLSEPSFSGERMPELELFLFCGETLGNRTVRKLRERFLAARIVNTYGPTESTVAVTEVLVDETLAGAEEPLPVGRPKPGTVIEIRDPEGNALPQGEKGEIIILGDTVSTGYYGQAELTERAFFTVQEGERRIRGYHTGDKGYMKNGMLYYCGRIDLQIKLHGYRIELEDIENNIRRLPEIEHVVVVPNSRGGKVSSLTAYVVVHDCGEAGGWKNIQGQNESGDQKDICSQNRSGDQKDICGQNGSGDQKNICGQNGSGDQKAAYGQREENSPKAACGKEERGRNETGRKLAQHLKDRLHTYLPDYMVPKKIVFLDQMPMTNNGKADRKKLGGAIQ